LNHQIDRINIAFLSQSEEYISDQLAVEQNFFINLNAMASRQMREVMHGDGVNEY
jgi:hypothetical protein